MSLAAPRSWRKRGALALAYLLAAALLELWSHSYVVQPGLSLCYPPAALYLGATLAFGWRALPLAFFGPLASLLVAPGHAPVALPGAILLAAAALTTPALALALLGRRQPRRGPLGFRRGPLAFAAAIPLAALGEAALSTAAYLFLGLAEAPAWKPVAFASWASVALPGLAFTPALLSLRWPLRRRENVALGRTLAHRGAIGLLAVAAAWAALTTGVGSHGPRLYLAFLPVLWGALAGGLRGAAWATATVAAAAVALAPRLLPGSVPLLEAQLFLTVVAAAGLVTGTVVSERRRTQAALASREEELRALVENVPGAVFRCAGGPPWGLLHATEELFALTGRPRGERLAPGPGLPDLAAPEDAPQVARALANALAAPTGAEAEYRLRRPDGSTRWVLQRARAVRGADRDAPLVLDGVLLDVTERRAVEAERREAEARARRLKDALLGLATNPRVTLAAPEAAARTVTEAAAEALGVDRASVWLLDGDGTELRCLDLYDRSDQSHRVAPPLETARYPNYIAALASGRGLDAADAGADPRCRELVPGYLTPHGIGALLDAAIWVRGRVAGVVCHEQRGGPRAWAADEIAFAEQLGHQVGAVLLHQEQRQADRALEHAQRLESLGVLAGGIAHDFNNLLMGVLGNAELALPKTEPDSTVRGCLTRIRGAALRASELTHQMLSYAGKGNVAVERVHLGDLVTELGDLLAAAVSKRATVEYRLAPGLPPLLADASQLRQVVMNLLTNASDALAEGIGTITVETGRAREGLFLRVTDTGVGMDDGTRARIFDPFFTTKSTGRGLGLAAVRGIVRSHGGEIRVESAPGRGSSFTVLLPADAGGPGEDRTNPLPEASPAPPGATVLVVDDEEAVRNAARAILEESGYRVVEAVDGPAGVGALARTGPVAAVLLDLTMPGWTGAETLRRLKEARPGVPVIASSGFPEAEVAAEFPPGEVVGFLAKPYRAEVLLGAVRRALEAA